MTATEAAAQAFRARFSVEPDGVAFAPGRVNLIGEHVDYNDGLVLPMPVAQGTAVAWRRTNNGKAAIHAADFGADDIYQVALANKLDVVDWRAYCRGMMAHAPVVPDTGVQLAIAGDLARGAGLSSSASLCVAVGRALAAAAGEIVDPVALARAAQQAEHDYAGVACGIMDQMAVAAGEPGKAMLLDCRDLSYRSIAIPPNWAILVVSSGVERGLVDGEYNQRRAQCAEAAGLLDVSSLRDATRARFDSTVLPDLISDRARHVISEIARVREAVEAIKNADINAMARILRDGHASLRDLFAVSVPPVDRLVTQLQEVLGSDGGARMTGAGFGGSVVVIALRDRAKVVSDLCGSAATWVYG